LKRRTAQIRRGHPEVREHEAQRILTDRAARPFVRTFVMGPPHLKDV
jgi:hypothetical protein